MEDSATRRDGIEVQPDGSIRTVSYSVPIYDIARCPEHGIHGMRADCFACGGPVEQVPMVPLAEYDKLLARYKELAEQKRPGTTSSKPWHVHTFLPGNLSPGSCVVCGYPKAASHHVS